MTELAETQEPPSHVPSGPEQKPMSLAAALLCAACNRDIDFFPRERAAGKIALVPTEAVIRRLSEGMRDWKPDDPDQIDAAIDLASRSLDEVKAQTEYQDQKATRLLTVTTFLTAFAGAVFLRFADAFPLAKILTELSLLNVGAGLSYVLFGSFILLATCGALVTFHATRTRFKYIPGDLVAGDKVRSRLFFRAIASSTPEAWTGTYVADEPKHPRGEISKDLSAAYLRDLVGETYLVACKTADKLRMLDPAQSFLAYALRCLLLWILSLTILLPFASRHPDQDERSEAPAATGTKENNQAVEEGNAPGPLVDERDAPAAGTPPLRAPKPSGDTAPHATQNGRNG